VQQPDEHHGRADAGPPGVHPAGIRPGHRRSAAPRPPGPSAAPAAAARPRSSRLPARSRPPRRPCAHGRGRAGLRVRLRAGRGGRRALLRFFPLFPSRARGGDAKSADERPKQRSGAARGERELPGGCAPRGCRCALPGLAGFRRHRVRGKPGCAELPLHRAALLFSRRGFNENGPRAPRSAGLLSA